MHAAIILLAVDVKNTYLILMQSINQLYAVVISDVLARLWVFTPGSLFVYLLPDQRAAGWVCLGCSPWPFHGGGLLTLVSLSVNSCTLQWAMKGPIPSLFGPEARPSPCGTFHGLETGWTLWKVVSSGSKDTCNGYKPM